MESGTTAIGTPKSENRRGRRLFRAPAWKCSGNFPDEALKLESMPDFTPCASARAWNRV